MPRLQRSSRDLAHHRQVRLVLSKVPLQLSLEAACGNGIQRIGDKFGKTLSAFRFPPAIASALTDICRHDPQAQETQAADTE